MWERKWVIQLDVLFLFCFGFVFCGKKRFEFSWNASTLKVWALRARRSHARQLTDVHQIHSRTFFLSETVQSSCCSRPSPPAGLLAHRHTLKSVSTCSAREIGGLVGKGGWSNRIQGKERTWWLVVQQWPLSSFAKNQSEHSSPFLSKWL